MLGAGFYHSTYNDVSKTYSTASVTVDSLTLTGLQTDSTTGQLIPVDSVLYKNSSTSQVFLPLEKFKTETRFLIRINGTIDTLYIQHTNYNQYLSFECGYIKTYTIDTILTTNHAIDSIRIVSHTVNTVNAEHIHIFI